MLQKLHSLYEASAVSLAAQASIDACHLAPSLHLLQATWCAVVANVHCMLLTCPRLLQVGGYHLPKGMWVHVNIWHMHHNEEYFTDAQKFKPERWLGDKEGVKEPNAYMPFGSGPRMCIAFKLACKWLCTSI